MPGWLPLAISVTLAGHFAPSAAENNRYVKVELRPDAVRIVYTVYFGERPGALERRRMDRDRDERIDEDEARAFGQGLLAELSQALTVEVDGAPAAATWRVADVGLGTPLAAGGSFSVDLKLDAPLGNGARGAHTVWVDDLWPVPDPGETELRVEEAPGVRVRRSHLGRRGEGALYQFSYRGAPAPGRSGIFVGYDVEEDARGAAAGRAARPGGTGVGARWLVLLAVLSLTGVAAAVAARVYRKTKG